MQVKPSGRTDKPPWRGDFQTGPTGIEAQCNACVTATVQHHGSMSSDVTYLGPAAPLHLAWRRAGGQLGRQKVCGRLPAETWPVASIPCGPRPLVTPLCEARSLTSVFELAFQPPGLQFDGRLIIRVILQVDRNCQPDCAPDGVLPLHKFFTSSPLE